ncbi:Heterokaryon incompatibility protein (HET) domain containing protein [Naviculisporaceae sp. PSN 640]
MASPLCEYCAVLPLDPRQLDAKHRSELKKSLLPCIWKLGNVERIRSSSCRLCQLVSTALYHECRLRCSPPIPDNHEVQLESNKRGSEPLFFIKVYPPTGSGLQFWQFMLYDHDIQIYFVRHPSLGAVPRPLDCVPPARGGAIDIHRIRQWIDSCLHSHSDCNAGEASSPEKERSADADPQGRPISDSHGGLDIIRLLDVQDRCLVETVDSVRYVALSYLWGLAVNVRLTTANYPDLVHRPGSLDKYWSSLPRTIQDAITLVREIGERYLWCDALCLVQNDKVDVQRGLKSMDYIYEQALFTIVGAYGHNADAGLPGLLPGSRLSARTSGILDEVISDVTLGLDIPLGLSMHATTYRSRGWTFQEELLSRRRVYFVDGRVYFHCQSTTESENGFPQATTELEKLGRYLPGDDIQRLSQFRDPLPAFIQILEVYSKRALTYPADALNAMRGIVRRVSDKMSCDFLEGIPRSAFDFIILFSGVSTSPLRRRQDFPSYSWTGWIGEAKLVWLIETYDLFRTKAEGKAARMNRWLTDNTWIIWYALSPDGTRGLVWDPQANSDFPWDDPEYVGYRTRAPFHLPELRIKTTHTHPTIETRHALARPLHALNRGYHLLQFWTLSVFLHLRDINIQDGTAKVLDTTDDCICGYLYIDGLEDTPFYETKSGKYGPPRVYELILLSSTKCPWWELRPYFGADSEEYSSEPMKRYERDFLCQCYNVMVLEWMGNVAERRGMGIILQSSVLHSLPPGPVWKEIVLG